MRLTRSICTLVPAMSCIVVVLLVRNEIPEWVSNGAVAAIVAIYALTIGRISFDKSQTK